MPLQFARGGGVWDALAPDMVTFAGLKDEPGIELNTKTYSFFELATKVRAVFDATG